MDESISQRIRSSTIDLPINRSSKRYSRISGIDPLFLFDSIDESYKGIISSVFEVNNNLPLFRGEIFSEITMNEIISCFISHGFSQLISSPSSLLVDFAEYIKNAFNPFWSSILYYWPPIITNPSNEAKSVTSLLLLILTRLRSPKSLEFINWLSVYAIPSRITIQKHGSDPIIKACCLCHRKRKMFSEHRFFWAILDANKHFSLFRIEDGSILNHMECEVDSIILSRSKKTIKIISSSNEILKRFVPVDNFQSILWENALTPNPFPFPSCLSSCVKPVPELLIIALNSELCKDDMIIVKALTDYNVSRVVDGLPLAEALFDVFAYSGKVNQLLIELSQNEFSFPELTHNTVLRGNSHLTNMFKVFFNRFGVKYYQKYLKQVIKYIDHKGDIGLKTPVTADSQKAQTMVFTIFDSLFTSLKYVPTEIRHFGSILKTFSAIRFNSKQAAYNTLSGFFCLRFFSAILSNPKSFDPSIELQNDFLKVLVPLAQLLMNPFNLIDLQQKYEVFNSWNDRLRKHVHPKLVEFVFSIGEIDTMPEYTPPSKERLREALETILDEIGKTKGAFSEKYRSLLQSNNEKSSLGWCFASFLSSYFDQTVND